MAYKIVEKELEMCHKNSALNNCLLFGYLSFLHHAWVAVFGNQSKVIKLIEEKKKKFKINLYLHNLIKDYSYYLSWIIWFFYVICDS